MSVRELAEAYDCSVSYMNRFLNSRNPDKKPGHGQELKLAPVKDAVIADYQDGMSMLKLSKKYGTAVDTVDNALTQWGVRERYKPRYDINPNALDDDSDPQVIYWLDYLAENARISQETYMVLLTVLPHQVMGEMNELRKFLGTNKPPEIRDDGKVRLRIYSRPIWEAVRRRKEQRESMQSA